MQYRTVPKTGDKLSILGYGCMRLPSKLGSIDKKTAGRQIYEAIDRGVNYLDTAIPYHGGKSEPFLGEILSANSYRQKVRLATKLPHWSVNSKQEMEKTLDEQLKRLRTDCIDYYLIHNLNGSSWQDAKEKGVLDFLDTALKSGKIANAGFSYHGGTQDFTGVVDDYDWTFCQIQYNILDTRNQAGTKGLKYAASKDLAVMIMEPLRGGNLAKTPPPEIKKIWHQAKQQRSHVEWALRWIWNHPEVTVVLSGMNNDDHIRQNLAMADEATEDCLSADEIAMIKAVRTRFLDLMKINCTGCQYCMPCPEGVNIPGCFESYNSKQVFKDRSARLFYLGNNGGVLSKKVSLASRCVQCGACLEKCPQNIAIPDHLARVTETMEGFLAPPLLWLIDKLMKVRRA